MTAFSAFWLAEGLDRVNLFYGYDEPAPQSGPQRTTASRSTRA